MLCANSLSPRTPPNCALCRNHGLKIILKGHKRYCKFKNCDCEQCRLTIKRQRIMALQTTLRRAQSQDEARALLRGEIPPPAPSSSSLHHHHQHIFHNHHNQTSKSPDEHKNDDEMTVSTPEQSSEDSRDSLSASPSSTSGDEPIMSVTSSRKLIPINSYGASNMPIDQRPEVLFESCRKLLEKFRYPYELMPLMYVILKDAKADFEEASRRIDEGQVAFNNYFREHNLNIYGDKLRGTKR